MAAKILNIEVGDRLVKVCCTQLNKKGSRVLESFMFKTPEGCVTDGLIEDPETLSDELVAQLTESRLRNIKGVVFTVASGKIASREVKLPPVKDKLLPQLVETNATDYFPVDLSKYHVTYVLLERVKGVDAHCRVLVLAAPLNLLEGYFRLADFAGLNIKAIDSSTNSHYQALRILKEQSVTMFIDVDCTASFVSFIQNDSLLLQRTFAFGGDELISGYMSAEGKSAKQYLEAYSELTVSAPAFVGAGAVSEQDTADGLSRLVNSIARSADYFNSSRWEAATAQVVLMGPCGHLIGLKEAITAATGLPTLYLEELSQAELISQGLDNASFYIGCIGSNLQPINFMPEHLRRSRKGAKLQTNETSIATGVAACAIFVVAAVAVSVMSIAAYKSANQERAAMKAEIGSLEYAEQIFLTYDAYQQGDQALLQVEAMTDNPNARLVDFFEELEKKMPAKILLLSASCTAEGVSMNLTVPGYDEAAVVLSQLRSFDSLSSAEVSSVSKETDEAGFETVSFSVNCLYGENPYLTYKNPYGDVFTETEEQAQPETNEGQVQQ